VKRPLKKLLEDKRRWHHPPTSQELALGFKGWRSRGYLPHFDAPGVRQSVTYRLADALPAERLHEWASYSRLEDQAEKQRKIEGYLDLGHGACHLRGPRVAEIIEENLLHFDGERYRVLAWCVMPNHVHVVIEVWDIPLAELLHSWKSYTSKRCDEVLGLTGHFWQDEYFDRYIRDEEHLRKVVNYVEENPLKARLCRSAGDWPWSSARHRDEYGRLRLSPENRSAGGPPARVCERSDDFEGKPDDV